MRITNEINKSIFREYDIRGIYGTDLTEDVAYTLGRSFGTYIKRYNSTKTIVGYDNRLSSPVLHNALVKGLIDSGSDVIDLGLVTTPMYYYGRIKYNVPTSIMITASHNPKEYNGFKISFESWGNAYGKYIQDFMNFTLEGNFDSGLGQVKKEDLRDAYIKLLTNSLNLGTKKLKVVLDCGNGTGSIIIKDVFDSLGIEYYPLYCDSDGNFPNHHPDPSIPSNMVDLGEKVVELGYDFGIGIDGDADRVGIVDENGKFIAADLYMLIMYRYLNKCLNVRKGLFDVKCSKTLIDELKKLDIEPVMYRTGNSYCNMKMQEGNFDFGGEFSGHVFFRDKFLGFDDGIYAGLRMYEVLSNSDKTLSEWLEGINKYYSTSELKINVADDKKFKVVESVKEYAINNDYKFVDIDGVRIEFENGWALVRASNTGPNITMRFEASTLELLEDLSKEFKNLLDGLVSNLDNE
ncbi:MAG: phosphomannomutase/phosphoglucomutase [Bacilli bacterium]|nr:phosphomannomutase/phosphoglucomutase [Bacilli bacterium]